MTGQPRPPEDSNAGAGAAGSSGASPSPAAGGGDFRATVPAADATVVFDWDETVPGQGDCQAGSYAGTFTCEYVPAGGDPNLPLAIVTGPVTMTLEESESGEFLEIADGELVGIAQLVIGFQAKLSGRLDCATNEFEATAVDGVYGFGDPSALPLGNFEGGLGGSLDRQTVTLSGEWSLSEAMGGTCAGPWEARFTP